MNIVIQADVFVIIAVTILITALFYLIGKKVNKIDPLAKMPLWLSAVVWLVEALDNMAITNVGPKYAKMMTPYLINIAVYIFTCNILGLFALPSPSSNFSVTFTLAAFTWVFQQAAIFKANGFGGYMHGFIEPIPVFLPMNVIGKFSTWLSMSLRLFGNILAGGVMMSLIYSFTEIVSNLVVPFNILGPLVTPVFHAYFDVFAGFIQTLIFITLTVVLVGNELPEEIKQVQ